MTNPYACEIAGVRVLGTNGSNIKDMRLYCKDYLNEPMAALEATLNARIIYPTCPDTIRAYPAKQDPFIVTKAPDVYFCGNQE